MVGTPIAAICFKCKGVTPRQEIYRGLCIPCVAEWAEATDPWLIYQIQTRLPDRAIPKTLMKQMGELEARVLEPIDDYDFLPLTQFRGSRGIAHQRSLWNFFQALYTFELESTAEAAKLGLIYPNTVHLCGRHAPVSRFSIQGFWNRIHSCGEEFKPFYRDRNFRDFVRGFVADNRIYSAVYGKSGVDVYRRESQRIVDSTFGKAHFDKFSPVCWPFESEADGQGRELGQKEELPDVVMRVGALVPARMPASLREDLCQDLCVAVLTGEVKVEDLEIEAVMGRYIKSAFKLHPMRYGRYSLHVTTEWGEKTTDVKRSFDHVTDDDISPERARHKFYDYVIEPEPNQHHHCGGAKIGDVLREKNDGFAIQGPNVIVEQDEMDDEIAEVYHADSHPQWRRRLSD